MKSSKGSTDDLRQMSRAIKEREFGVNKTDIGPCCLDVQSHVDMVCNSTHVQLTHITSNQYYNVSFISLTGNKLSAH